MSNSIVIPFHCNYNKHPDIWPNCPPRISSGEQSGHSFSCRQNRCEASIVSCTIHTYVEDSYCVSISCGQVHRFQINVGHLLVHCLFVIDLSGYPRLCCAYHLYGDIMCSKAKSSIFQETWLSHSHLESHWWAISDTDLREMNGKGHNLPTEL